MKAPYWFQQVAKLIGTSLWIATVAWLAHYFADGNTMLAGVQR
jgi:hypothetical protein